MVQLTTAHPTLPTSSSLTRFIYAFNGSFSESKYIFLCNTHHFLVFSIDELPADIYSSMSHINFDL